MLSKKSATCHFIQNCNACLRPPYNISRGWEHSCAHHSYTTLYQGLSGFSLASSMVLDERWTAVLLWNESNEHQTKPSEETVVLIKLSPSWWAAMIKKLEKEKQTRNDAFPDGKILRAYEGLWYNAVLESPVGITFVERKDKSGGFGYEWNLLFWLAGTFSVLWRKMTKGFILVLAVYWRGVFWSKFTSRCMRSLLIEKTISHSLLQQKCGAQEPGLGKYIYLWCFHFIFICWSIDLSFVQTKKSLAFSVFVEHFPLSIVSAELPKIKFWELIPCFQRSIRTNSYQLSTKWLYVLLRQYIDWVTLLVSAPYTSATFSNGTVIILLPI